MTGRYLPYAFALLLLATTAQAHPLQISLHPREDRMPAPWSGEGSAKPAALALLDCLNSLVAGNTARAEKSCSDALAVNPGNHDAYKLRGYAYLTDHRFERAAGDFEAALRLKPRDDEDRAGYAQSLSGQGRFNEAVGQYRKALALAPAKAPYWNGLCWARAGSGRKLDQALDDCNRALALQPGAAAALNSRGLVYLRLKQYRRAIADYTASLAAGPLQASARFGRGLARLFAGEGAKGAADIAQARRRDPDIDGLFVMLDVLPLTCISHPAPPLCPNGFPPLKAGPSAYLVAAESPLRSTPVSRRP